LNFNSALDLTAVRFGKGGHPAVRYPSGDRDMCIMEAVAFMADEPWSDQPACACPVISGLLRVWNDSLSSEDRDRLLPADKWVPRLIGSRRGTPTEQRRSYLALDWLVRTYLPAWLDLTPAFADHAAALRGLPEIVDPAAEAQASVAIEKVIEDSTDHINPGCVTHDQGFYDRVFGACGGDAVDGAATGGTNQIDIALHNAVKAATRLDVDLSPTVETLQQSVLDLLDRMLTCK